jgi:hypothetical protein
MKQISPGSPLALQPPANDAGPTRAKYTNDFRPSDPLAALRARIGGLPDNSGPRPLAERHPAQLSRPQFDGPPRQFGPTLKHTSAMRPCAEM